MFLCFVLIQGNDVPLNFILFYFFFRFFLFSFNSEFIKKKKMQNGVVLGVLTAATN